MILALMLCESLTKLTLANTTITNAQIVAAGAFHLPPGGPTAAAEFFTAFDRLPAFCRVQATSTPSADSHIEVEVWLPAFAGSLAVKNPKSAKRAEKPKKG